MKQETKIKLLMGCYYFTFTLLVIYAIACFLLPIVGVFKLLFN